MYLTFYTNSAPYQLTWEDVLNNPYEIMTSAPTKKKVTKIITEEYGQRLWNKTHPNGDPGTYLIPLNEVPDTSQHYRHFQIPKKSDPNKMRQIDAPDEILSNFQQIYKAVIEDTYKVLPHKAAHAYVEKHSTATAMKVHQKNNSKWFLQIDLKDFFNSINGTWLKNMLLEVYPFKYIEQDNLDKIIKAALLNDSLPQGSHLSPLLTNLAMAPIDHDLTEKLHNYRGHHYVYTRYADDITISCKEKFDPKDILKEIKWIFRTWNVPFKINNDKTRFGNTSGRNYHLGLILNKDNQISVGHEKNQKFRAMIFNFCTVGEEWEIHDVQKMLGLISYYKAIEPEFVRKTLQKYNEKFNTDIEAKAKALIAP